MTLEGYDKTNVSAYKYLESIYEDMVRLCKPLDDYLGIKQFQYLRWFLDGRQIFIANQLDYPRFALEFFLKEKSLIWDEARPLTSPSKEQFFPLLWPTAPNSPITQAIHSYGFWNGISFCKILPDSLETWVFMGDIHSSYLQEFYLRNEKVLLNFIQYFKSKAAYVIKCDKGEEFKFGFYKHAHELPRKPPVAENTLKIKDFLETIQKHPKGASNFFFLTYQEINCLSRLTKGETMKEIGRSLSLSPRTVETHLNAVKHKTGYSLRSDLVKLFLDYFEGIY